MLIKQARGLAAAMLIFVAAMSLSADTPPLSFSIATTTDLGVADPVGRVVADFDQDGRFDLLVTGSNALKLFHGTDGAVLAPAASTPFGVATAVAVADFNADGYLDAVVTQDLAAKQSFYGDICGSTIGIGLFLGPTFASGRCIATMQRVVGVQTGDFDGDGRPDVAVVSASGSGLWIYTGSWFVSPFTVRILPVGGGELRATGLAAPADLNGDGTLDLVVPHAAGVKTFFGHGDGTFSAGPAVSSGATAAAVVGRLNGDASLDVAWIESGTSGRVLVALGSPTTTFTPQVVATIATQAPGLTDVAIADFDHDGDADLVVADRGRGTIVVFLGNGDGTFVATTAAAVTPRPRLLATADWDRDGDIDVVIFDNGGVGAGAVASIALQDGGGALDTAPPTVAITSPAAESTIIGRVAMAAAASDDVGVTRVDFYAGGALIGRSAGPAFIASWDSSASTNGPVVLTAWAYDAAGNVGASAPVPVSVGNPSPPDAVPPTVVVPAAITVEATGPAGAVVAFEVSATDDGDAYVQPACDRASGETFPLGTTTVTCRATDSSGNSGVASFTISVRDTTPPAITAPAAISVPATDLGGLRADVAGSIASRTLRAFIDGATAVDVHDTVLLALPPRAQIGDAVVDVTPTTLFPPGATSVVFRVRDASGNEASATSTVTVTERIVDEPTMVLATAAGAERLKALQNPDGGWSFQVGSAACGGDYGTCTNTIGSTALGLLAAYVRSADASLLAAARAAGDLLAARYELAIAQTPPKLPVSQDLEFLVALARLTEQASYADIAQAWFQITVDRFPNVADEIDDVIAKRDRQGMRSVAAWDAASYIRAAKAVGQVDRAIAAAIRIRDLEPLWKDTDPAHRLDQCADAAGCGPSGNQKAFDYTILGEGSLLWAIHDLPGFDAQIDEYRAFLLAQQDRGGAWDAGDSQITAFVIMGLAAVGGTNTNGAIAAAAGFFLKHQLPAAGWPQRIEDGVATGEFAEVDGEIVRAASALFSTPAGVSVSVLPSQLSSITFGAVTTAGLTTVVAVDPSAVPAASGSFQVLGGATYQIATTAAISGDITVCFSVPWITDPIIFAAVRILHGEDGTLVDRTIVAPDEPAPDFGQRRVCARTTSLSPFAVAIVNHVPAAFDAAYALRKSLSITGRLVGGDEDGDALRFEIVTPPSQGILFTDPSTGAFTYTARARSSGRDLFMFRVTDGALWSEVATVTLRRVDGGKDQR